MLPPFGWSAVVTQWQFAPVVTVLVVICAGLYGWGVVRVARRHPARPWPLWRTGMFAGGLAVIVIATQSGVGAYDDVLFWDHMVQHLMLIMVAPPLLIFGQPMTLLLHASRNPLPMPSRRRRLGGTTNRQPQKCFSPATMSRICVRGGPAFRPHSWTIPRSASRRQTTWFPIWSSISRPDSLRHGPGWKNSGRKGRRPPLKICAWL